MTKHRSLSAFLSSLLLTITLLKLSIVRASFHGRRSVAAFMSPSRDLHQLDEDIVIPHREYGYAEKPLTWSQLENIIEKEQNLAKLSRSVEQQRDYMIYQRNLLKEWKTVYDLILCSKFGLGKRLVDNPDNDGRNETLWEAYPPLSQVSEVRKALCPNDFPYYTAEGIEHWCLWKLCEDLTKDELEEAKEDLRCMNHDELDFLCWRNPPHLKSLPDIDHYHMIFRKTGRPVQPNPAEEDN